MAKQPVAGSAGHQKTLSGLLRDNARRTGLHQVFADFCELSAVAVSNKVDKLQFAAREARYFDIIKRYERDEIERFAHMFAVLTEWLGCGFADRLGELFMSLEMGDRWRGQFFTPFSVSSTMAQLALGDVRAQFAEKPFMTFCEPACGAGGMLIACADAINSQTIDYTRKMHAVGIDIDATAVHMAYLQLSLYGVPAIVIHGNALALEERAHWVTPMHVYGGWDHRLQRHRKEQAPPAEDEPAPLQVATAGAAVVARRVEQMGLF